VGLICPAGHEIVNTPAINLSKYAIHFVSLLSTLIPFVLRKVMTQTFKVHLRRRSLLFIASNETLNIIRSENDSIVSSYHEISGRFAFTVAYTHTDTHTQRQRTLRSAFCANISNLIACKV
jgi:hypothetical protein